MQKERILEKVRKVLAKSENNPSAHEVEVALLKAQEILAKHGLSMADVNESAEVEVEVMDIGVTLFTKTPWWHKRLAKIISENFRCLGYLRHSNGKTRIKFVGLEEDVEIAKEVFCYAKNLVTVLAKSFLDEIKKDDVLGIVISSKMVRGIKNDFISGFLDGLEYKFKSQVNNNEWGLVLKVDDIVEKYFKMIDIHAKTKHEVLMVGSKHAYDRGYKEGTNFEVIKGYIEKNS